MTIKLRTKILYYTWYSIFVYMNTQTKQCILCNKEIVIHNLNRSNPVFLCYNTIV